MVLGGCLPLGADPPPQNHHTLANVFTAVSRGWLVIPSAQHMRRLCNHQVPLVESSLGTGQGSVGQSRRWSVGQLGSGLLKGLGLEFLRKSGGQSFFRCLLGGTPNGEIGGLEVLVWGECPPTHHLWHVACSSCDQQRLQPHGRLEQAFHGSILC